MSRIQPGSASPPRPVPRTLELMVHLQRGLRVNMDPRIARH